MRIYRDDWGVHFPEANLPVLSWRLCRSLALPRSFLYRISTSTMTEAFARNDNETALLYCSLQRLLTLLPPFSLNLPAHRNRTEPRANLPTEQVSFVELEEKEEGFEWPRNGDGRGNLPEVMLVAGLVVLVRQIYAHEGGEACVPLPRSSESKY